MQNFRIAGDTLEFDIVHQAMAPYSRSTAMSSRTIAMNEMRIDARHPDQTGPGFIASLLGPISIEATAGNVVRE